jgi:predicted nucleotidyltransferase component of viral defense system
MHRIKLSKLQADALRFFGRDEFAKNFYWTGGTLLSWQYLKHRDSVDLDFFSDDLFLEEQYLLFIKRLKKNLRLSRISLKQEMNRRQYLLARGNDNIKLELVYFPFPALYKRNKTREFSVKIDSLADLMTNKTLAAYQRNEPKDIYDLYFCLSKKLRGISLPKLLSNVEKKFEIAIEPVLFLAKANELADQLDAIRPLLFHESGNVGLQVKKFFQKIFDLIAKKKIK